MFSPNQLYDYLRYYCINNKKNATVLNPTNIGSKKLTDFDIAHSPYVARKDDIVFSPTNGNQFRESSGCITMYDQEPFDINAYFNTTYPLIANDDFRREFDLIDFVCSRSMAIYTPIAAVSEVNSASVNILKTNQHEIFYFWSNALTSRYWFQHYELLTATNKKSHKRLGCYIRDTTGTREYRKKLLKFFKTVNNEVFCPLMMSDQTDVPSDASATIVWPDCEEFDIQIVPETIFNTEKIHLTEKTFKPIVMFQPFVLLAGPKSLSYLRHYGFKTFSDLWDESYDQESDSNKRLCMITELMKTLLRMDTTSYNEMMLKANKITEFNRNYFYSEKFKTLIMNELYTNLDNALGVQEDNFHNVPGGTLFYYYDVYFKKTGNIPTSESFNISASNALKYAYTKSRKVGDAIVRKYSHLL